MALDRWAYILRERWRSLFRSPVVERELDDELRDHVARAVETGMARGLSRHEARRRALLDLGGLTQQKEAMRDARGLQWLHSLAQDLRYAMRVIPRTPGISSVVVLTMALAIGASTAMFTVVDGVLLKAPPFPHADRLLVLSYMPRPQRVESLVGRLQSPTAGLLFDADFIELRERTASFEALTTFALTPRAVTGAGEPANVMTASVTREFLSVLGVAPAVGHGFAPSSAEPANDHVALVSDEWWRGRLGADPSVVGRRIDIDGVAYEISGVMPPGFSFPSGAQLWTPFAVRRDPTRTQMRPTVGRLRAGRSPDQAAAEFAAIAKGFSPMPGRNPDIWQSTVAPLVDLLVGNARPSLWVFSCAVAFVLLIACANVASLLLTRATGQGHEMAIRSALGAGRRRLIRQSLTETSLLSLIGGGVGFVLAAMLLRVVLAQAPADLLPRRESIGIDGSVFVFSLALSALAGLVAGLAPAWRATRPSPQDRLSRGGRTVSPRHERTRDVLAVTEVALAVVLVTGAGLFLKSFLRLRAVDPGFRPDHLVELTVDLPSRSYPSLASIENFHSNMLDQLSGAPSTPPAAVNWLPLGGPFIMGGFVVADRSVHGIVDKSIVTPGYFRTMGIPVRGREFDASDRNGTPLVAIASESAARRIWPGSNPIGQRISLFEPPHPPVWLTVVGVVGDVRQQGLGSAGDAAIYQPFAQATDLEFLSRISYVARVDSDAAPALSAMRAALHNVDPLIPAHSVSTMDDLMASTTAEPRFQARLVGLFAALALFMAAVGVYGVLAHSVQVRTREIAIRIALGAPASDILWRVLGRAMALALAGVANGIGVSLAATRALATLLFAVRPNDPMTLVLTAAVLVAAAFLAAVVPALRARRVDPIVALQTE